MQEGGEVMLWPKIRRRLRSQQMARDILRKSVDDMREENWRLLVKFNKLTDQVMKMGAKS